MMYSNENTSSEEKKLLEEMDKFKKKSKIRKKADINYKKYDELCSREILKSLKKKVGPKKLDKSRLEHFKSLYGRRFVGGAFEPGEANKTEYKKKEDKEINEIEEILTNTTKDLISMFEYLNGYKDIGRDCRPVDETKSTIKWILKNICLLYTSPSPRD